MKKELKVGLFAVGIIALAVWGFNYLKGKDLLDRQREFYGVYQYVNGLELGQKVVINGFGVGRVNRIEFLPDGSGNLLVEFVLSTKFPISINTVAVIKADGLLGTKLVEFELGDSKELAQVGDTLATDIEGSLTEEVNKQVLPIKNKAEKMLGSIDTVLVYIQNILNQDTRDNVSQSMERINSTFKKMDNIITNLDVIVSGSLKSMVASVDSITTVIKNNSKELDNTLKGFAELGEAMQGSDMKTMFANVNSTIAKADSIVTKINDGTGSAGMLVNDPDLYYNLERASKELDEMLRDLKNNPERYVQFSIFGRKSKPYIAPEN